MIIKIKNVWSISKHIYYIKIIKYFVSGNYESCLHFIFFYNNYYELMNHR